MLVFAVAAVKLGPDWAKVGNGFVPHITQNNPLLYRVLRRSGLLGAAMTPYEVYFYSSGGVEERWGAEGHRPEPGERDRRLRARRHALARADDRRRRGLPRPRDLSRSTSARSRSAPRRRSGRSACCSRSSASSSRSAAPRSTPSSPAPTTSRSSAAGSGGATAIRRGAPRFTLTWLVLLVLAIGDRDDRRRPGRAHRVRGHLLRRRASAHLPPDPARRERPRLHGRYAQRPARERRSASSTSS